MIHLTLSSCVISIKRAEKSLPKPGPLLRGFALLIHSEAGMSHKSLHFPGVTVSSWFSSSPQPFGC